MDGILKHTEDTEYQICVRCIMDTTDTEITFDEAGVCWHCQRFDWLAPISWFPDAEGERRLAGIVEKIKSEGKGKEYDSILGLSGGIDSSYLACKAKELGLRPLVVHIDCGWNSELAVKNIETIVKKLDYDLFTYVVDWQEMQDLQVAFVRAGVANQDVPQDHAILAKLYQFATKNKIKYVLSGGNIATESVLPASWGHDSKDSTHILGIHKKFGKRKLKTFPMVSLFDTHFYFRYVKRMRVIRILNYLPYDKEKAIEMLETQMGWRYYGGKHHESRFTKFFQAYYLPTKFGFDKRRAHLSSLVLAGQKSRQQALSEMEKPLYDESDLARDRDFVLKKLGLSDNEFSSLMAAPNKTYLDYPNQAKTRRFLRKIWWAIRRKPTES